MSIGPFLEPFRDPRNVAGLLADVGDLICVNLPDDPADVATAVRDSFAHVRKFSEASRTVLRGAARSGHAQLFRSVEQTYTRLINAWSDYCHRVWNANKRPSELCVGIADVAIRIVAAAMVEKTKLAWTLNGSPTYMPPEQATWMAAIGESGVDVAMLELPWRFKDVTDRRHCGASMRAAFEAAWMAKQYKFARQLVSG